jgi:hypothetical protein
MTRFIAAFIIAFVITSAAVAGPKVTIVHAEKPSAYETQALELLTEQLQKLFDAEVAKSISIPTTAENVILLGRPETNGALKLAVGARWPQLSEQGHVLRTIGDKPATLLLGGGSDLATFWAVAEFGHHHGIRSLVGGDVYPPLKPGFTLTGYDRVLEPLIPTRWWAVESTSPLDVGAWSLADQQRVQSQLRKLKFNALSTQHDTYPNAFKAIKIASDAPGRRAFGNDLRWYNPDVVPSDEASAAAFIAKLRTMGMHHGLPARTIIPVTPIGLSIRDLGPWPQSHLRAVEKQLSSSAVAPAPVEVWVRVAADAEAALYYIARRTWDATVTAERATHDLYTDMAGRDDVAGRMQLAFDHLEQANDKQAKLFAEHKLSFEPGPNMMTQFLSVKADLEPGLKDVAASYTLSMNEFLRAHGNAAGETRPLFFYFSKRAEYAFHLSNAHLALAAAAKARGAKQADAEVEQLEKAVESLYNGLNSLSEVARDQSDRGVIAVLNEWGFKPLNAELERLSQ